MNNKLIDLIESPAIVGLFYCIEYTFAINYSVCKEV